MSIELRPGTGVTPSRRQTRADGAGTPTRMGAAHLHDARFDRRAIWRRQVSGFDDLSTKPFRPSAA